MADDDLSLDFTLPGALTAPVEKPVPAVAATPAPTFELVDVDAPPLEKPKAAVPPKPVCSLPKALTEAAILHAEGKPLDAVRRLEAALKSKENLGGEALRAWAGLFDLLQALNRRPAFDSLALAFARHFEKSPPMWRNTAVAGEKSPDTDAFPLGGQLTAGSAPALKQATAVTGDVQLELGQLTAVDNNGATLLLRLAASLKKAKRRLILRHPHALISHIKPGLVVGERKDESLWLLLLELYQQSGQQDPYEETALNYAVTFEVSPPAWIPLPAKPLPAVADPADRAAAALTTGFGLNGTLAGNPAGCFAALEKLLATADKIEIDASELERMDAVTATQFKQILAPHAAAGKRILIAGLPSLVAAYLETLGLADVAELKHRTL